MILTVHCRKFWFFCFLICLVSVSFLALSSDPPSLSKTLTDKTNHILAFVCLDFMLWLSFPHSRAIHRIAILLGYGCLLEFVQHFTPQRHASLLDVGADFLGIQLMEIILYCFTRAHIGISSQVVPKK